jgi:ABC-2 type transport system permease protein
MRAIDLAIKDLMQLVRNRMTAMFLVAMPVIFTLLFGFAFGGFGGGTEDPRLPVGFIDGDGSQLSASLRSMLETSSVIRPTVLEGADAEMAQVEKQVRQEDLAAALVVPAGYGEQMLAGELVPLQVIVDQGSTAGTTAQNEIQAVTARLAGSVEAARLSTQAYADQVGFADEAARRKFLQDTLDQAITAWADPPLTVDVRQSGAIASGEQGSQTTSTGFAHASPSMMVQFAIAGLIGAATILVMERKTGALRRLLTTAVSRVEIIFGHYLAMVIMILAQLVILVAFGQIALKVPYLRAPLATALVMVATALWTASLGLLIGTLAKSDDQATIFSLVAMFVLAGIGGAWVPLEFTGKTFQAIGHVLPTAWAMDGFENIVVRGMGLGSVWLPVGIMLAYAVVLFGLAAWRFKFE